MIQDKNYILKILLALDRLLAVLLYNAYDEETVSCFVGRTMHGSWQEAAIDWVFLKITGKKDHCLSNVEERFVTAEMAVTRRGDADAQ